MENPLLAPSVALAAGVTAARYVPFGPGELIAGACMLCAAAAVARFLGSRRTALAAILPALFFSGALASVVHRRPARPELDVTARDVAVLAGCVVEPPAFSEDREQFTLELEPGARARISLYAPAGTRLPDVGYGERIELDARVRRTHNFQNPGAFDYAAYLARQDIYWTGSARADTLRRLGTGCGSAFAKWIYGLRGAALDRIDRLYQGSTYRIAMMQAILIGESSRLEKIWTEDFRRTGTYHALVISGMHLTVIAALLLFLMRVLAVPAPAAMFVTVAAAWVYTAVANWQAPVARAAAGFTLFAIARLFYRRPRVLNLLAAVAIGFIIFDPEELFDASFQLSFLSVAAIGALAAPLVERTTAPLARGAHGLSDIDRDLRMDRRAAHFRVELRLIAETAALWTGISERWWMPALSLLARGLFYAVEVFVISGCVQLGLALPMALYFHRLSITGLSANLLIVPMLSTAVPLGFLAVFTAWSVPAILAAWLLNASQAVAEWHVRWEPGWRIPDPPFWLAALTVASTVLLALAHRGGAETLMRRRMFKGCVCLAALSLALVVWHPFPPLIEPRAVELTAIDVGQAESLFLALPDGKLMLVDAGGFPATGRGRRPRLDIGEDVVSPYLWTRSIRRLDAVVISHPHEDHIGGMAAVIGNFHPRELWTGTVADVTEWRRVRRRAELESVRMVQLAGGRRFRYGGVLFDVLWPPEGHVPSPFKPNNDSLVLRLTYGGHSLLLTGDIERQVEAVLPAAGIRADVLKVPHHGSRTSSTAPFLDFVHPVFAVISAGYENSFNNPSDDVLERLEERKATILRTDVRGLVSVRTDGKRFRVERFASLY